MASGAREVVLGRIRAALGGAASAESARAEWAGIRREYRRSASRERGAVIELLVDRLRDYDAQVVEVGGAMLAAAAARDDGGAWGAAAGGSGGSARGFDGGGF